jgi:hypothetical protein
MIRCPDCGDPLVGYDECAACAEDARIERLNAPAARPEAPAVVRCPDCGNQLVGFEVCRNCAEAARGAPLRSVEPAVPTPPEYDPLNQTAVDPRAPRRAAKVGGAAAVVVALAIMLGIAVGHGSGPPRGNGPIQRDSAILARDLRQESHLDSRLPLQASSNRDERAAIVEYLQFVKGIEADKVALVSYTLQNVQVVYGDRSGGGLPEPATRAAQLEWSKGNNWSSIAARFKEQPAPVPCATFQARYSAHLDAVSGYLAHTAKALDSTESNPLQGERAVAALDADASHTRERAAEAESSLATLCSRYGIGKTWSVHVAIN